MRFKFVIVLAVLFTFVPMTVCAGELAAPAAPDDADSAMHTVEDIYNRLDRGTVTQKRTGAFIEPSAAPAATGHSLDDVMDKAPVPDDTGGAAAPDDVKKGKKFWGLRTDAWGLQAGTLEDASYPAPVAKTNNTNGDNGVAWPVPRFTDNGDETVTDNLTGLMWAKNANMTRKSWEEAKSYCDDLSHANYDDWRLPNLNELSSLIDRSKLNPALPDGHPFSNIQSYYWSSTVYSGDMSIAWDMDMYDGDANDADKSYPSVVWPVRGQ